MQNSSLGNVCEGNISRKFGEIRAPRHWKKTAKTNKIYNTTVTGKKMCLCHIHSRSSFTYMVSSIDSLRNGSKRITLLENWVAFYKSTNKRESWCANPLLIQRNIQPPLKAEGFLIIEYWSLNCNPWRSYSSAVGRSQPQGGNTLTVLGISCIL